MGTIILTSTGLSGSKVAAQFLKLAQDNGYESVAIVTTASPDKADNKYAKLTTKQLNDAGLHDITFVDLETDPTYDFSSHNVIFVMGGNTFYLLKFARQANFVNSIKDLLKRGGCYVGISAGSILVGTSLALSEDVGGDSNDVGLIDLSGLNLVPFIIVPHYEPDMESIIQEYEKHNPTPVERLRDGEAIVVDDVGDTKI